MDRYDRQIRLFGMDTQMKLSKLTAQVLGQPSYALAEITKNLILLGVGNVVITEDIRSDATGLVFGLLSEINTDVKIDVSEEPVKCDFLFTSENSMACKNCYFVCPRCYMLETTAQKHLCSQTEDGGLEPELAMAKGCLLGAFAVQEFLKAVQGTENVKQFKVNFWK